MPVANIIRQDDPGCVDEAVRLLWQGELICYPTDTVYGVGATATNDAAVKRLYAVKGRPLDKPMPLLIADAADAHLYADLTPLARSLMGRFWPGGLTLIMRKAEGFDSLALAGERKVGLRVPDQRVVREIIRGLREPIIGTSANRAGARPPASAQEAAFQLGEMVSLVIDGGASRLRQESTVLDTTTDPPKVLREGVVSREELREAIGKDVESVGEDR